MFELSYIFETNIANQFISINLVWLIDWNNPE